MDAKGLQYMKLAGVMKNWLSLSRAARQLAGPADIDIIGKEFVKARAQNPTF